MKLVDLSYDEAMAALENGQAVKLPEWHGHWFKRDGRILVETRAGEILDTPFLDDYHNRNDWFITDTLRDWQGIQYCLDAGKMVQRLGWNGKGMFVFMRPKNDLSQDIVAKLNPMTEEVRKVLMAVGEPITFSAYYCLWNGKYVSNGWMPSNEDLRADDWRIVHPENFGI